jgi:hypothetical protein
VESANNYAPIDSSDQRLADTILDHLAMARWIQVYADRLAPLPVQERERLLIDVDFFLSELIQGHGVLGGK